MAGEASRNKVNIGASSLILIFIVLCMATFGLLSISSAQGDLRLGELYNRETGLISTDIPMDRGQSLRIELVLMCGEKHYDIKSWYVYASDEYEIDNSMPVWGGAAPSQE